MNQNVLAAKKEVVEEVKTLAKETNNVVVCEYRADKDGNVNLAVGKVSFEPSKLEENANAVISQILKVRPASVKGVYVKSCHLSTTMGPSIKLNIVG